MMNVKRLSFSYKSQSILDEVSFSLKKGEITGLVAPNGTGKTTLLKLLANLLPTKQGEFLIDGENQREMSYKKRIFFLENVEGLMRELSVLDHLKMIQSFWQSEVELSWVLEKFSLEDIQNKPIRKLSLGQKQSVLLMLYVMSDAEVLLFDEPTNALDPTNVLVMNEMMDYLREKGKIILYSSHNLENLKLLADRIFFLKNQKIIEMENDASIFNSYQTLFVQEEKVKKWT
ncbi:ABC-2 type transport system ATP-binding protein [Pilibacter termitis]|uniref:ABC-2 type transport system ATP-binding protein n=1 Tax=Pilibacter termitis TaxID=263852 RepID=A0A1T4KZS5_9ENTE|nr:ABC transporter ATP-binding protein [Pilibacter termitis]SJZ47936.1 ABC-2 type transport system ATP-binding protein [Pilibacter termitis]